MALLQNISKNKILLKINFWDNLVFCSWSKHNPPPYLYLFFENKGGCFYPILALFGALTQRGLKPLYIVIIFQPNLFLAPAGPYPNIK